MLLSHCGEYPCECKHLIFAANSPEMIRLVRRITETSEALQMVTNVCEILTNPCEFLTKLTITICRISCESFANVKNTYECPCERC